MSSYGDYLRAPRRRATWLRTDRLLGEHGIHRDGARGRAEFAARTQTQRTKDEPAVHVELRRGWRLGAEDFLERLLAVRPLRAQSGHGKAVYEETEEALARRIVREELDRAGWQPGELLERAKGDAGKVKIAQRLRKETALTLGQIAQLLHMGAPTHVAHLLYHRR